MDDPASRRRILLTVGAISTAMAGCAEGELPGSGAADGADGAGSDQAMSDATDDGGDDTGQGADDDQDDTGSTGSSDDAADDGTGEAVAWPAIEMGELISDFGEDARLEALHGTFEGNEADAQVGAQALTVENDGDRAAVSLHFPDGLDLDGWDASMAVKATQINRIAIEFHAPTFGEHLTSFRRLPNDHDDWLRVDFGYDEKQGDPDLSDVKELRIFGFAAGDGLTRFTIDDLRRTPAAENGKAILVCYGGRLSHYEIAAELLEARGWPAVVAMDPRRIGDSGRMDVHDLRELQDRGWDISPAPQGPNGLSGLPEAEQQTIMETAQEALENRDFADGARHFFAPEWRSMDPTNHAIARDRFESAFVFGSSTSGIPPTGMHLIPMSWGPALHAGIRRQINLADQYQLLVVLRIPNIVDIEDDVTDNNMWIDDFVHLLDHLEHRGLDVITPSDIVDDTMDRDRDDEPPDDRPTGTIFDAGQQHTFDGDGDAQTEAFSLDEGVLIGQFSHQGSDEFNVTIDGDVRNAAWIRTAGATNGHSVVVVDADTYRLDVEADGPWSIELSQPAVDSDDLTGVPLEETGSTSAFIGPIWAEGDGRVDATHDGEGSFLVDLYAADGSWEQVINSSGSFDSSRSYRGPGVCWLNIEATGDWTIEMV